jgi:predicted nuclease of predicted toxin-antitoxin system
MALAFYMDTHVHQAITDGLRLRGIDVLTAREDGMHEADDDTLLERATELDRVLFTFDEDFKKETTRWQGMGRDFTGVIYIHLHKVRIGRCIEDLETIARVMEPDAVRNRIFYLPL